MFPRSLTTLLLTLAVTFGTQIFMEADADAKPGSILVSSRSNGKRTHKGRASSSSSKSASSKSKKKSSSSRRTVRKSSPQQTGRTRTTTTRTTRPATRTTTTRTTRPTTRRTTTRTVRSSRPQASHHRTRTVHHRPSSHRTSYYRSGYTRHHSRRHSTHHHRHTSHSHTSHHTTTTSTARSPRSHGRATTEPYVTGGLGLSGFNSKAIVDGPALPGIGYNLAIGAKGKLFGGEFGLNGGGYTFEPGTISTDLGLIGLSGDLKIQPAISFFEPFAAVGLGGYILNDGIINESSAGIGLRLQAGADFRFDDAAIRVSYLFGAYGLGNEHDAYGGDFGARTETLSAGLLFYF